MPKTVTYLLSMSAMLVFALALAAIPVAYQTNDDPYIALILAGSDVLQMDSDFRALFPNALLGWFIQKLYQISPGLQWWGIFIGLCYALSFGSICATAAGGKPFRLMLLVIGGGLLLFLLPLLLVQYTVVAGTLVVAGILPWICCPNDRELPGYGQRVVSAAFILLAFLIRAEMAIGVLILSLVPLGTSLLIGSGGSRLKAAGVFCAVVAVLLLGSAAFDYLSYEVEPDRLRAMEFNDARSELSKTGNPVADAAGYKKLGWTGNEFAMLRGQMAVDAGPFELSTLRAALEVSSSRATEPAQTRSSSQMKVAGMVQGRDPKHLRLTGYLAAVLAAAFALGVGALFFGDRKATWLTASAAAAAGFGCVLTIVVLDKAVFRVLFPLLLLLLSVSTAAFPWRRLRDLGALEPLPRSMIVAAAVVFLLAFAAATGIGVVQLGINAKRGNAIADTLARIAQLPRAERPLIAWSRAVPIEYLSPFASRDAFSYGMLPIDWHASHPVSLARLREAFGEAVYDGLTDSQTVHLVDSPARIDMLSQLAARHYGRDVEGVRLAVFDTAGRVTEAWRLQPVARNPSEL
ncbi:MAG: hypothetical protein QNJ73_15490 [Gammaproteobacteria bacterium]|nr:hypothetical protein [Gammaproteobacteria bacterium]